jgi:hypothetical protein
MLLAMEHIRRMRGGAQSHLMRCSDGNYYVVKFQNNPQHRRVLVNEMLGTRMASRLGLPTAPVAVVQVQEELIRLTPELCVELPRSRMPCQPGLQFASRYPGDPRQLTLHDFLPDEKLREVGNLHDFAGMLVFDKWTCNTNGRQTLFFEQNEQPTKGQLTKGQPAKGVSPGAAGPRSSVPVYESPSCHATLPQTTMHQTPRYRTVMIDQGFCFNAGEWTFPDAPLRGLYARNRVYEGVTGLSSFAPWLERLERGITARTLSDAAGEIPPEWYEDDYDAVLQLLEKLENRRTRVPELIVSAKETTRQPFPFWV